MKVHVSPPPPRREVQAGSQGRPRNFHQLRGGVETLTTGFCPLIIIMEFSACLRPDCSDVCRVSQLPPPGNVFTAFSEIIQYFNAFGPQVDTIFWWTGLPWDAQVGTDMPPDERGAAWRLMREGLHGV